MTESLIASLLGMCDRQSLGSIAGALGESEQAVSGAVKSSITSVLGGIASKSADPVALRNILDLAPKEFDWSTCAAAASDPNSPWIGTGKRILSTVFGPSEDAVTGAVSAESGLRRSTVFSLLAMAAPMVVGYLNRMVRNEGMTIGALGNLLQRESASIQGAMPAGLSDLFWPRTRAATPITPATQRAAARPVGFPSWLPIFGLCMLALIAFWLLTPVRRAPVGENMRGTASRMADGSYGTGQFVQRKLPDNVEIKVPEHGTEQVVMAYEQDPNAPVDGRQVEFDRVTFDPGSANIRPESGEQMDNMVAILTAYPNMKLKIFGYAADSGNAAQNAELAQARAESAKAWLASKGIAPDRLEAQGFSEGAGNYTPGVQNRGITLQITQK